LHAFQLCDKIHVHFHAHTRAKAIQLKDELRNSKKGDCSVSCAVFGKKKKMWRERGERESKMRKYSEFLV